MKRAISLFNSYTELKNVNNKPPLMTLIDLLSAELKALNDIKCSYCNANACIYVHSNNNSSQIRKKKYSCIKHEIKLSNEYHNCAYL